MTTRPNTANTTHPSFPNSNSKFLMSHVSYHISFCQIFFEGCPFDEWGLLCQYFSLLTLSRSPTPSVDTSDARRSTSDNINSTTGQAPGPLSYDDFPRSTNSLKMDRHLAKVRQWHETLQRPVGMHDNKYAPFVRYAQHFSLRDSRLWRKESQGKHQLVLEPDRRLSVLRQAHDEIGHRGVYLTHAHLIERFWWPSIQDDIKWYIQTCHMCQVRQSCNLLIPPIDTRYLGRSMQPATGQTRCVTFSTQGSEKVSIDLV